LDNLKQWTSLVTNEMRSKLSFTVSNSNKVAYTSFLYFCNYNDVSDTNHFASVMVSNDYLTQHIVSDIPAGDGKTANLFLV
jgi:hypothetical protein